MRTGQVSSGDRLRYLVAGGLSGLSAGLLFAAAHAALIVPIWQRMLSGLLFATVAGVAIGWAYGECRVDASRPGEAGPPGIHAARGARFGALLWLAVLPVTAADALLRATGLAPRYELLAVASAVLLAVLGGAALGSRLGGTWRARIACAAATLSLTLAMAGPVPVARSTRALGIFLAVLPVAVLAGAELGVIVWILRRRRTAIEQKASAAGTL
jgi:hypothetical protein